MNAGPVWQWGRASRQFLAMIQERCAETPVKSSHFAGGPFPLWPPLTLPVTHLDAFHSHLGCVPVTFTRHPRPQNALCRAFLGIKRPGKSYTDLTLPPGSFTLLAAQLVSTHAIGSIVQTIHQDLNSERNRDRFSCFANSCCAT
jgi:hypothetical protein